MSDVSIPHPQVQKAIDNDPFQDDETIAALRDVQLDELEVTDDHRNAVAWHMYETLGWMGNDLSGHDGDAVDL